MVRDRMYAHCINICNTQKTNVDTVHTTEPREDKPRRLHITYPSVLACLKHLNYSAHPRARVIVVEESAMVLLTSMATGIHLDGQSNHTIIPRQHLRCTRIIPNLKIDSVSVDGDTESFRSTLRKISLEIIAGGVASRAENVGVIGYVAIKEPTAIAVEGAGGCCHAQERDG
ncbi:hypothetical protein BDZ94DRAFT_1308460 [Collybia nuda]|uniref:Uncharacterized protein n=1 Tax=Collybia nuda TaxID=64659 RepID=A0A9P5Y7R4_9AGAR|nr:hypothetical protein BDZ94DRAFT_1308460 [Collybia nuda]